MIIGNIDSIHKLEMYGSGFKTAIEWLKSKNLKEIADGKYTIQGALFAAVQTYDTKSYQDGIFEAHKRYIDIQIVISGLEWTYCINPVEGYKITTPYDKEQDIMFYAKEPCEQKMTQITLYEGNFAVFFPDDWHMPCISPNKVTSNKIKKIVVKIPIE
jgi:YhcH/YjgK/YiaL family protein